MSVAIKGIDHDLPKDRFSIVKSYHFGKRKVLVRSGLTSSECSKFPIARQQDDEGTYTYQQVLTSQLETLGVQP